MVYRKVTYRVERTGNKDFPYRLHGARGKTIVLYRLAYSPAFMWAVDWKTLKNLPGKFTDLGDVPYEKSKFNQSVAECRAIGKGPLREVKD